LELLLGMRNLLQFCLKFEGHFCIVRHVMEANTI
jgi:hypothetical protein